MVEAPGVEVESTLRIQYEVILEDDAFGLRTPVGYRSRIVHLTTHNLSRNTVTDTRTKTIALTRLTGPQEDVSRVASVGVSPAMHHTLTDLHTWSGLPFEPNKCGLILLERGSTTIRFQPERETLPP